MKKIHAFFYGIARRFNWEDLMWWHGMSAGLSAIEISADIQAREGKNMWDAM